MADTYHNSNGLHDQMILRLPDNLAQKMQEALNDNYSAFPDFHLEFNEYKKDHGIFRYGKKEYPFIVQELPCMIESFRTADEQALYKSGDVGHVIVVSETMDPDPAPVASSGLTSASIDVEANRFVSDVLPPGDKGWEFTPMPEATDPYTYSIDLKDVGPRGQAPRRAAPSRQTRAEMENRSREARVRARLEKINNEIEVTTVKMGQFEANVNVHARLAAELKEFEAQRDELEDQLTG